MTKLFLPQNVLEEWTLEERADLRDGALNVTGEPTSYPVAEAFHFTQLVSGPDEHKLLEKVKTQEQLGKLGAEVMSTSVIAGESAYEVVPGFSVDVPAAVLGATAPPAAVPPPAAKPPTAEADLLAEFLLNKL